MLTTLWAGNNMLKFKQFISEEVSEILDIDEKHLTANRDAINAELEVLTSRPYQNAAVFLTQLRGCLERYGILLPQSLTKNFMDLSCEMVYGLGDSDDNFYVVYDTNDDGFVDGYAQIVDSDELDDLMSADLEDNVNSEREAVKMRSSTWYARREDDGGKNSEYGGVDIPVT